MSKPNQHWLIPLLRPLRPVFREVMGISLFVNVLALAAPLFVLQVYDRVISHAGLTTLQGLVAGMALLLLFDFVLREARSRLLQRVALKIDVDVGRRLFAKVQSLPLATLERRPAAVWQGLFRDVETVRNTLSGATAVLAADLPFLVVFLALVVMIAQPIAWVMVAAVVAFMALAWYSAAALEAAGRDEREAQSARDRLVAESIQARATIKALGLGEALRQSWEERHAATLEQAILRGRRSDRFVSLGMTLTTLTTVALVAVGALAILDQKMTIGTLIAANMLTGRLLGPLNQLVANWRSVSAFRQSVRRLGDLFAEPHEAHEAVIAHDRPRGELRLERVSFAYGDSRPPVLSEVSAAFASGGLTAVLGRNGSGKTTLVKLLLGLYRPASGRVLLDGADMTQFTRRELASWIGYVPQDSVLLDGSIRDAIALGHPGASDDDILRAARLAGADGFIHDLPGGFATVVGEGGAALSGGQRQRLAIARALVGDPPILVLDEPSASLDRAAEEALRDLLDELARERTVVVVTHSPAILAACRSLLVLDGGRVMAAGPAAELLPKLFGGRRPLGRSPAGEAA